MANNGKKQPSPFCIRFTEQERKSLGQAAGDRAMAAYIRWLIFKDEFPAIRTRKKRNEQETWQAYLRDQKERENLIQVQLGDRQSLQIQMNELHRQHDLERQELMRDMSQIKGYEQEIFYSQEYSNSRDKDGETDFGFDGFGLDDDFDHEL